MNRFGFYSASAATLYGYEIWLTPEGKEVKVTGTDYSLAGTSYLWRDKKCVGQVVRKLEKRLRPSEVVVL